MSTTKDYDVSLWEQNYVQIPAVQGEAQSRTVNINLKEEATVKNSLGNLEIRKKPFDVTGYSARLYIKKLDGSKVFFDGTITDAENGVVSFTLPFQATASAGENVGTVYLTKPDDTTLKAIGLTFNVQANNLDGSIESTDDFSALVIALNKADTAAAQIEQAEKSSETAVANANAAIATVTANETTRQSNEQTRQTNESTRRSDESARNIAETARATAETARQQQESARQAQEQSRKDAESTRIGAETSRNSNEDTRKANETARQAAESTRDSNENTRKANETARQTAETDREAVEKISRDAEAGREDAESHRATAEKSRASAESARVAAENKRQTDTQKAVSNANTAASGANTAADRANTAAQNAEGVIAGQLDPAIDARITAKSDVPGGIAGYDGAAAHYSNTTMHTTQTEKDKIATAVPDTRKVNGHALSDDVTITASDLGAIDAKTLNGYGTNNGSKSVLLSGRKAGTTIGDMSIAEGSNTTARGYCSHAEGYNTTAKGHYSHAEGSNTTASGDFSHAEGYNTTASSYLSHVEGRNNLSCNGVLYTIRSYIADLKILTLDSISGLNVGDLLQIKVTGSAPVTDVRIDIIDRNNVYLSTTEVITSNWAYAVKKIPQSGYPCEVYPVHSEGLNTTATGSSSHSEGSGTIANVYASHTMGTYNRPLVGNFNDYLATADAFVIGNGTSSSALSNAFRVTFDGKVYGLSAFNSSGADYSEFFEWLDGNPNNEDRVGHFVTLDGEKIKYANDGDYIVGIVSATPAIVGDNPSESWSNRWTTDIFGRIQYHDVEVPEHKEIITHEDGTTEEIEAIPAHTEIQPIVNPDYSPELENDYINREKRKEWSTVGMLGKLIVVDDGTCEVNGYCKPSNGIATKADTGYRVIARLDDTHIKVLIK